MSIGYDYSDSKVEDLIEQDRNFLLVLPHFQRKFVWDEKKQKSLLQSILSGIPIGSILLLNDKKDSYTSRPLCFDELEPKITDEKCIFLLDGQQRISTLKSMFYDLFSEKEVKRFEVNDWKELLDKSPSKLHCRWFLKIDDDNDIFGLKSLNFDKEKIFDPTDFEECIKCKKISRTRSDEYNPGSTMEDLINWSVTNKLLPLYLLNESLYPPRIILNRIVKNKYLDETEYNNKERKISEWVDMILDFLKERTFKTKIHNITLNEKAGMQIGIPIFEQVNRGGIPLDIYDLLVARMAYSGKNLTDEIHKICSKTQPVTMLDNGISSFDAKNMGIWKKEDNIPEKVFKKAFKNCLAICVLKNRNKLKDITDRYIKERNLLTLTKEEIKNNWKETIKILLKVLQFLHLRCGVVKLNDIPYELLVVPLFVFFLKDEKPSIKKMMFWYWSSIFSGYYREKQSTRVISDSKIIINGGDFGDRLKKVFNELGYSDKNSIVRKREDSRQPQLDKAIIQYVLSTEPYDLKKDTKNHQRIKLAAYKFAQSDIAFEKNIHHIIPLNEISEENTDKLRKDLDHPVNSAINKVIISKEANWKIQKVSDYANPENQLNCETNFIPQPNDKKYTKLGKYDLKTFLSDRFNLLSKKISEDLEHLITP